MDAHAHPHRLRLLGFILLVGCLWGVLYSFYAIGLARAGPWWLAALRFDAFCVAALVACLATGQRVRAPATRGEWGAVVAYGVLNVALHNLGMMIGAQYVPVAVVGIAAGVNPILTVALARVFHPGTPWSRTLGVALLSGFAGVGVLAFAKGDGTFGLDPWALVVVAGVAAWSLGSVIIKSTGASLPMLLVAFWGSAVGVLVLQPAAFVLEPTPRMDWTLAGVIVYLSVFGGLLAFLIWMRVVRRYGATQANLVSFFSPVATSIAGFLLLGQPIGYVHLVAYLLIALGLFLAVRELSQKEKTSGTEARASSVPGEA
jgi:drug/metabolite transporter (DMT)-like permease